MEFDALRRLINSVEGQLQQNRQEIEQALGEHDELAPNENHFDAVGAFLESEHADVNHLHQMSMNSLFIGLWAVFEFRLLESCQYAQRQSAKPDTPIRSQNYSVDKAKADLKRLCVPAPKGQWNELKRLNRVRNVIAHYGGYLEYNHENPFCKYAKNEQIIQIPDSVGEPPDESVEQNQRVQLTLHTEFVIGKLDILKKFLIALLLTCENQVAQHNNAAMPSNSPRDNLDKE